MLNIQQGHRFGTNQSSGTKTTTCVLSVHIQQIQNCTGYMSLTPVTWTRIKLLHKDNAWITFWRAEPAPNPAVRTSSACWGVQWRLHHWQSDQLFGLLMDDASDATWHTSYFWLNMWHMADGHTFTHMSASAAEEQRQYSLLWVLFVSAQHQL